MLCGLKLMKFIGAVLASLFIGASGASAQVVLKLGTVDVQASHSGVGADAFAAEVSRLSNGQMKVEVFHAGKLGGIPDQIKNVLQGTQDIHLLYPEFLANLIDESKIISAPYVFRDIEHAQTYLKSDLFKPGLDKLNSLGGIVLDTTWSWKQQDPRGLIAVRPVKTPQDLQGMKVRLWESRTAIETWRGLGANTVVVPRGEMYLAFTQGIIEAGPETIGIAYDQKNAELAKFWTRTDEYYQILNLMMNRSKYQNLTPQQREVLHQAARNAAAVFTSESKRGFTEKKAKAVKDYQVTVLEPDLTPWRKRSEQIVADLESQGVIPKGLVAKARALK
jgi:TRAP-type C4-dicarboxylate transport system substrate-binding protein